MAVFDESEGYSPVPADSEPPEGLDELALEESIVGSDASARSQPAPPVIGRTWALDPDRGRLLPMGSQPVSIRGIAAMRQAVEKCLRTERTGAPVNDERYGYDGADRDIEGQPFSAETFGSMEERVRAALTTSLPWVLDIDAFDADPDLHDTTRAEVSFRVIPDGENLSAFDVERLPLPLPAV